MQPRDANTKLISSSGKRIAIVCIGSRGDVDPFCSLGKALQSFGHSVTLITHDASADQVVQHGLEFAGLGTDPVEARQSEAGKAVDHAGACGKLGALKGFFHPLVVGWATKAHAALKSSEKKPDLCVLSTLAVSIVTPACEALAVPFIAAHLMPLHPTVAFAPPVGFGDGHSTCFTAAKWRLSSSIGWKLLYKEPDAVVRGQLGLTALPKKNKSGYWDYVLADAVPVLMGWSASLVPRPADWPSHVHVCGHLALPSMPYTPPVDLEHFLAKAPAARSSCPVFLGLGSMMGAAFDSDLQRLGVLRAWVLAATYAGCDAIIDLQHCGEWVLAAIREDGVLATAGPRLFFLSHPVPHSWLFPQCSMVACHGGAGTVHQALAAGCPVIGMPCLPSESDQPFWAGVCHRTGVSPTAGLLAARLGTGGKLGRAIKRVLQDPTMFERAASLCAAMKEEAHGGARAAAQVVVDAANAAAARARVGGPTLGMPHEVIATYQSANAL